MEKKAIKIASAKKQLEKILSNCEPVATSGENNVIINNGFVCEFHKDFTKDDLLKRAAAFDRACYHDKKINGGLAVQAAIAFILDHKENAKNIIIKSSTNNYTWCRSWFAYLDGKKLYQVKFTNSDFNYALDVLRIERA